MRFDDRIATVLALAGGQPAAGAAKWRQLVDLLAQARGGDLSGVERAAFDYLAEERAQVPAAIRRQVAEALAGREVSPPLLAFFAADDAVISAPLFISARLSTDAWLALLPQLTPPARALIRHRDDLPTEVVRALGSFGSSDFALAGEGGSAPAAVVSIEAGSAGPGGDAQIRDLVARIEAFRQNRETAAADEPAPDAVEEFRWEAGSDGVLLWVEDAPRGPLIGQTIATMAERGLYGVDGQAAGAFEKRTPFRDARFRIAGKGPAAGDWRISGVPFFDPASGSFLGYRGSARRPRLDEVAHAGRDAASVGLMGTGIPADSLRQLIHELRTPLNAIVGFAEMIDGQFMGPAGAAYRSRAGEIMAQASRLLNAVDDLDTAARLETSRFAAGTEATDAVALLCRLHDAFERIADQRGSRLAVEIARDLPPAGVEQGAAERMFARLLAATIGLAGEGETIAATMRLEPCAGSRMLCLALDRPQAIAGFDADALLDPGYTPEGDWPAAPALGLGFALRLVRNLAEAVGGALAIGEERFALFLPAAIEVERSTGQA